MSKSSSYKIRPRGRSWQVVFPQRNGKQLRRSFKTRAEAEVFARKKALEIKRHGEAAFQFTHQQRRDAAEALEKLPKGSTLVETVDFYVAHSAPQGKEITVNALIPEYLNQKEIDDLRVTSINSIKVRLKPFAKRFGDSFVHEFTRSDLIAWLNEGGKQGPYRGRNRQSYARHLSGFFNYAVDQGYIKQSPVARLGKVKLTKESPAIMTVDDVERLLRTAQEQVCEIVPYYVIGFFCGIRPKEIKRLDWKDIDLEKAEIFISPETAKTRQVRFVELSPNAIVWLLPHKQKTGPIFYSRKLDEKARTLAGIDKWPQRVMRHCFASYHYVLHENAGKTAQQLGHWQNVEVLATHYRSGLVSKEAAEKFWDIVPSETQAKIISIER